MLYWPKSNPGERGQGVKKETIITAVVFFAVGFLAGYITDAQINWNTQKRPPSSSRAQDEGAGGMPATGGMRSATSQALPEGHPPVDNGTIVKTLQEEAAQNPKDPEAPLKLANYFYDQRQWQKAVEWYQKVLELDPRNVNARTDMGTAYYNLGQPEEALAQYRHTLEIDPNHQPTIFNSIVVSLDGTHDLTGAQKAWERLNKMNPKYPGLEALKKRLDEARASGGS